MAKRTLGLGNAARAKKQKLEQEGKSKSPTPSGSEDTANQLTIELPETVDANDEIAQLRGLYKTYIDSERDSDLILNGIIHECDRLLREKVANTSGSKEDQVSAELPAMFYKIYAIALSELANFHTDDIDQVSEFFDASLERVNDGLEKYPTDIDLVFTKAKILINQIVLQYVSQLKLESSVEEAHIKNMDIKGKLDAALRVYESAEKKAKESEDYLAFNSEEYWDILEAVDDLLDIVDNFGRQEEEEEEEDEEDDEDNDEEDEDEEEEIELPETHPLYIIKTTDEYNQWWRDHTLTYLSNLKQLSNASPRLLREVNHRLGQSYLQEAEVPSSVFTTLRYDEDYSGIEELEGLSEDDAKRVAQELIIKALEYLKAAEDNDEPESWVNIAEAMISLANLYEVESKEQEQLYQDAEKILTKANNATNGKYQDALDNLLG